MTRVREKATPRLLLATILVFFTPLAFPQGAHPAATTPSAETAAGPAAGKVDLVEGDVRFFDKAKIMRRPKSGEVLSEGESIATGTDGEVQLAMEDGGYIGVRPNTRMDVITFKAEGGEDDRSVIGLLQGSFRSVTGWIAKLGARSVTVRTPTATIGVRGTEHEPLVIPEGSREGEPGTYDRVHIGETVIETPQGSVSVRPNQAGFVPHRGAVRPRVLERVPAFYRPTRNESRFQGLHERLHAQLDKRREERRQFIQQRRKRQGQARDPRKGGTEQRQGESRQPAQRLQQQEQRKQLQEQRREQMQKQRESERKGRAEKARIEREQNRKTIEERRHKAGKPGESLRGERARKSRERPEERDPDVARPRIRRGE